MDQKEVLISQTWYAADKKNDFTILYQFGRNGKLLVSESGSARWMNWELVSKGKLLISDLAVLSLYDARCLDGRILGLYKSGTEQVQVFFCEEIVQTLKNEITTPQLDNLVIAPISSVTNQHATISNFVSDFPPIEQTYSEWSEEFLWNMWGRHVHVQNNAKAIEQKTDVGPNEDKPVKEFINDEEKPSVTESELKQVELEVNSVERRLQQLKSEKKELENEEKLILANRSKLLSRREYLRSVVANPSLSDHFIPEEHPELDKELLQVADLFNSVDVKEFTEMFIQFARHHILLITQVRQHRNYARLLNTGKIPMKVSEELFGKYRDNLAYQEALSKHIELKFAQCIASIK